MEVLKKITIARIGLEKDTLLKTCIDKEGPVAICRVFGRAFFPCESKLGDNGPYVLHKGMFEALNILTGKQFKAGQLILNGPAASMLEGQVLAAGEGGEVPFAYEIGVQYVKNGKGNPYQFTAKLLGEDKLITTDPLAEVRAVALGDVSKQIEAPANGAKVGAGKKEAATAKA